jgi:hypothetical protein
MRQEEEHWRLKSRSLWLKYGDSNTSFFHKQAQQRRKKNTVSKIQSESGKTIENFNQIKLAASQHFADLYSQRNQEENEIATQEMLEHIPHQITMEDNELLTQQISEEETLQAIRSLDQDKAPGPDGFSIRFFKHFWSLIKHDLRRMLNYTLWKKKVGGATNSTFLALIPKETNPSNFSIFRPISLCNSSYKILTKIIASRLKPLLLKLVSDNQGGFMENKQITDNIILVRKLFTPAEITKTKEWFSNWTWKMPLIV